ncbi:MAG: hypothetical protein HYS13_10210 [Planctomycetia bacterium]|nr:hypothetical protein [Planctomycetia bacterium]
MLLQAGLAFICAIVYSEIAPYFRVEPKRVQFDAILQVPERPLVAKSAPPNTELLSALTIHPHLDRPTRELYTALGSETTPLNAEILGHLGVYSPQALSLASRVTFSATIEVNRIPVRLFLCEEGLRAFGGLTISQRRGGPLFLVVADNQGRVLGYCIVTDDCDSSSAVTLTKLEVPGVEVSYARERVRRTWRCQFTSGSPPTTD